MIIKYKQVSFWRCVVSHVKKKKFTQIFSVSLSLLCVFISLSCVFNKASGALSQNENKITIVAAALAMPDGAKTIFQSSYGYTYSNGNIFSIEYDDTNELLYGDDYLEGQNDTSLTISSSEQDPDMEQIPAPNTVNSDGETMYQINERMIGASGTMFDNFSVKNTTSVDIDIAEELSKQPDINISKHSAPQVLIVHTHATEAYIDTDTGVFPESFYPRTTDPNYSVIKVGEAIKTQLVNSGINTLHDSTQHDNPSYNGAYYRSEDTIKDYLEQYPSIQVVLDIHRDSIGNNESGKVKPTFTYNNKKAAQIMIVAGCDDDGTWEFPDWEYNLRFALRLQQTTETLYPGMTRPLKFCPSQYNLHLTHGSLLVEIGTDVNTLDEAVYSGELLGNSLSQVLAELASS